MHWLAEAMGWLATLLFAASYLARSPATLRRAQAAAALLWIGYGWLIHSLPVMAANLLVTGFATYSLCRGKPAKTAAD